MENIAILIGKRITCARITRGLTQEQLAEKCSISVSSLSRIETGNSMPALKTLCTIANGLDVGIDYLLYDLSAKSGAYRLAPQTQEIISLLENMNEDDRQLALDIILSISRRRNN